MNISSQLKNKSMYKFKNINSGNMKRTTRKGYPLFSEVATAIVNTEIAANEIVLMKECERRKK